MRLIGTGVWSGHLRYGDARLVSEAAAELEELGYSAVWIPDVGGDVLGSVEELLRATARITVATGILNIWMHEAAEVADRRASWEDDWQRRFLLGLGVSHAPLIDHENPGRYRKPYSKMVEFLDALDRAEVPFPVDRRVLAALRPRMLRLARDRAAGVHPYFVPVEHVAKAREAVGPDKLIAVELAVVLDSDPGTARETARRHTAVYVNLPNYTNNLRDFGFGDDDFAERGSDRLVDAIVAWGDLDTIARRVSAMRGAGADHVCIQVIRPDDQMPRADWREIAPALVGS
ncbi:MAG: putative F420-dependent oxidoreductase [Actinomycetia bacterium]|nr:putative F420-dependent oxidoreductase [Actinomycetes bacterium]